MGKILQRVQAPTRGNHAEPAPVPCGPLDLCRVSTPSALWLKWSLPAELNAVHRAGRSKKTHMSH